MHRQVGDLSLNSGLARRGLLVRHLVLPDDLAGSAATIDFLADHISAETFINVMGQYRPEFRAHNYPELSRRPTSDQINRVRQYAAGRGLRLAN